ncbi:hypothetical protein HGA88_02440 [Candidatus Roizmanbacteria bacterium]|nr:hypothetical protein [Candidatus Roizmanbacteria bacterium]
MKLLTANTTDFWGKITPPPGSPSGDGAQGFSTLLTQGISLFVMVASIGLLVYLLWGTWDWLTSGGEKEKLEKAKQKITNSIIGFMLIFVAMSVFMLVTQQILHISGTNGFFDFKIPTIK